MATFTLIEVNGDFTSVIEHPEFGRVLRQVISNPSNKYLLEHYGFDRAVKVVSQSMYPLPPVKGGGVVNDG